MKFKASNRFSGESGGWEWGALRERERRSKISGLDRLKGEETEVTIVLGGGA